MAMATRLTPLGLLAKWVLAPAIIAVGGCFLLAPRLGPKAVDRIEHDLPTQVPNDKPPEQSKAIPNISVKVSPVADSDEDTPKPRVAHRKKHKKKPPEVTVHPAEDAPTPVAPATPEADPASGGAVENG